MSTIFSFFLVLWWYCLFSFSVLHLNVHGLDLEIFICELTLCLTKGTKQRIQSRDRCQQFCCQDFERAFMKPIYCDKFRATYLLVWIGRFSNSHTKLHPNFFWGCNSVQMYKLGILSANIYIGISSEDNVLQLKFNFLQPLTCHKKDSCILRKHKTNLRKDT